MLGNEITIFELRDVLGEVKEMITSKLTWPILYLMHAIYTMRGTIGHKICQNLTFLCHRPRRSVTARRNCLH